MDKRFKAKVLSSMGNPQQTVWAAMHQDYSEGFVCDNLDRFPDERTAGKLIVKHLLKGNRGHFGPLEHVQIVLNIGNFPHSTIQQLRTHRVGVSFDVQSMRYSGERIFDAVASKIGTPDQDLEYASLVNGLLSDEKKDWIEDLIYLRPCGIYTNRQGKTYSYSEEDRKIDLYDAAYLLFRYASKFNAGFSEEHARGLLPFDYRQHFVLSCNARSLMHLLDLRSKVDAQLEIQSLCNILMDHFLLWMPEVAEWYKDNRFTKARLSP